MSLLDPRRFVRMKPRGGVNPIVPLGERDCGSELVWCFATSDRQEARDARRVRPLDHGVAVGVEFAVGEVAVAVNECRF